MRIVVSKSFRGSSILDLRRKIVMAINPYTKVNILTILLKSEMPKDQWPEVKVADRQVALKAVLDGTAQAAIMDQPALATALETKDYRLLEANPRAKYIGSPYWSGSGAVLVTVWTERRDEFRRFFEALDEAIFYIRTNTESAHEILAQSLGLEKKIAVHCGGYYFPTTKEAVPMDGIRDTMKALVEAGLLESSFPVADFFPSGMYGRK